MTSGVVVRLRLRVGVSSGMSSWRGLGVRDEARNLGVGALLKGSSPGSKSGSGPPWRGPSTSTSLSWAEDWESVSEGDCEES